VAPGVDGSTVRELYAALLKEGAQPRLAGQRLGRIVTAQGGTLDVEITMEAAPSVMYDGMIVPPGEESARTLAADGRAIEFVRDQYRHGKPILALGDGVLLLHTAGLPATLPDGTQDPGLIVAAPADMGAALAAFKAMLARHRVYARETDPPRV
jgi:catalase